MTEPTEAQHHAGKEREIKLTIDGRPQNLTFEQAFALGHELWRRGKALESTLLFQRLHRHDDGNRPVRLMLARGLARLGKFQECHRLLHESFDEQNSDLACQLHDAFVLRALGDKRDAIHDVAEFAKNHPDFPTVCLILGDLWESLGRARHARAAYKLAAQRAQGHGAVAFSARHQLATLRQRDREDDEDQGDESLS